jgi:hypothetical protein
VKRFLGLKVENRWRTGDRVIHDLRVLAATEVIWARRAEENDRVSIVGEGKADVRSR